MASDIIASVDRTLEMLIYIYKAGEEVGITQIAEDMDLYKSTVFRTLTTLENRGFVIKNPKTEKYWLGNTLYILGKGVEDKIMLRDVVEPYAKKLGAIFDEVVNVSILDKNFENTYESILIYKEDSKKHALQASPKVGSSYPCYCSSVGKCLLAFTPGIDLDRYDIGKLNKNTAYTITTVDGLKQEIADVREKGYAIDREEQELGLTCIGAPILNFKGEAIAAISLSGPSARILEGDMQRKIQAVCDTAKQISANF